MRRAAPWGALSRRQLLAGLSLAPTLGWPRSGRAGVGVSASDRKFVFVFVTGGWDPAMVLADGLDNPNVDCESGLERAVAGGVPFQDAPTRPSVRRFFEQNYDRSLIVNGMLVPSIAHDVANSLIMTGKATGDAPDWPTLLGAAQADRFATPVWMLSGPSFPGELGWAVLRSGMEGQLGALLDGSILSRSRVPLSALSADSSAAIDAHVAARAARRAEAAVGADRQMSGALRDGLDRMGALQDAADTLDLSDVVDFSSAMRQSGRILGTGLARCVVCSAPTSFGREWDTHTDHFSTQTETWEALFSGLLALLEVLDATPGEVGATLADETTVVVLSEMGRTPLLNAFEGKDHWPFTSAMLIGSGVAGDRVIGGYDERWGGLGVDPATGEPDEEASPPSPGSLGAAILALGGVDPGEWLDEEPLEGALS